MSLIKFYLSSISKELLNVELNYNYFLPVSLCKVTDVEIKLNSVDGKLLKLSFFRDNANSRAGQSILDLISQVLK